jgi:hypothetical protein
LCNFFIFGFLLEHGHRPQGWEKWKPTPHFAYGSSRAPASISPPPFIKSIKSVIVGVVSGDGGRQRRWGVIREDGVVVRVGGSVFRVGGSVVRVGGSVVRIGRGLSEMSGGCQSRRARCQNRQGVVRDVRRLSE